MKVLRKEGHMLSNNANSCQFCKREGTQLSQPCIVDGEPQTELDRSPPLYFMSVFLHQTARANDFDSATFVNTYALLIGMVMASVKEGRRGEALAEIVLAIKKWTDLCDAMAKADGYAQIDDLGLDMSAIRLAMPGDVVATIGTAEQVAQAEEESDPFSVVLSSSDDEDGGDPPPKPN